MAAFHLRNIPDGTYERLRSRAQCTGRSINAEILVILERELGGPSAEEFDRRLARLQAEWTLPPGAPLPETLIRQDRNSR